MGATAKRTSVRTPASWVTADAETLLDCLRSDLGETPDGPVEAQPVDGAGEAALVGTTGPPVPATLGGVRRGASVSSLFAIGVDGSDDTALVTDLLAIVADRLPG